ncbi:MAG: hypothetical protein CM15mV111_120 [uncultured marine virus]|nr:MAG: hypothetical protein CM15mV111_120 [uncultured marine virus]
MLDVKVPAFLADISPYPENYDPPLVNINARDDRGKAATSNAGETITDETRCFSMNMLALGLTPEQVRDLPEGLDLSQPLDILVLLICLVFLCR